MPEQVSGGAAVVDALAAHGVTDVFGIPGTHNLEIYRHLATSSIRHVVTRHEQGAGYAADGYARVSGRPGVLLTTSGPGITNAITALATAYADSVPTLAISPGPPRGRVGKDVGWLHEMKHQQAALDAVCAASHRVEAADEIPDLVSEVFAGFRTSRPRPVHLEVPVDVLEGNWCRRPVHPVASPAPEQPSAAAAAVAAALRSAGRPLLVAGGGARTASEHVRALADLGVPVLTTVNGKGVLDERHPSALGASVRLPAAHRAMNDADLLLVVGSELGDSDLWGGHVDPASPERVLVRVDLDPHQLHKNVEASIPVLGDAATVLAGVVAELTNSGYRAPARETLTATREEIARDAAVDAGPWAALQQTLAAALPEDVVVAGDSSQVTYYGTVHYWPFTPSNRLIYPTGYATLGYGLPAAIGAKVAEPTRPVLALVGDGAAMFSVQEILTAVQQRLPLPVVVADNGGYAEIKQQMVEREITPQAVDLNGPDLAALAESMGAAGKRAGSPDEVAELAAKALHADGPTVIHYRVS
ncbi:MAG: thiamine pyrophosphate-binding protein [Nocardioidaceae bacterium]